MTVFVTGGSGLVGSALLKQLLREGYAVRALKHHSWPASLSEDERNHIQWIQGDILDISLLEEVLQGCRYVYHCAAIVSFHPSRRKDMYRFNIEGTANVVNACLTAGVDKLVHVSSVAALGRLRQGETVTEEAQWTADTGHSHYGRTKYLSELEVWRGIGEGLQATIVNPSIILGEANWHSGSSALFKKAWNSFPWYTNGGTGFIDAKDVAAAMILLMRSSISGERYILSHEQCSYRDLLGRIATCFGKKAPTRPAPEWIMQLLWRIEAMRAVFSSREPLLTKETVATAKTTTQYDTQKLKKALPELSFTPLDQTIGRTCAWLKEYYSLSS